MLHVPKKALLLARQSALNVDDVFKPHARSGTAATASIASGFAPDLVWIKNRNGTLDHYLFDRARGALNEINTNNTGAEASFTGSLTSFDAGGYTLGASNGVNGSANTFVDWAAKRADRFFASGQFTHTTGTASTISLSGLGTVGLAVVKATSTTSDWFAWHRTLTAGNNLRLNTTAAESTTSAHISVSGTTLTFAAAAPSATYQYYAFAHQPSGIIQCGEFATTGSTVTVELGWDIQYLLYKQRSGVGNWTVVDRARGLNSAGSGTYIPVNTTTTESASTTDIKTTSTGFTFFAGSGLNMLYMAIKRGAA